MGLHRPVELAPLFVHISATGSRSSTLFPETIMPIGGQTSGIY
jgi:hypothetical protein